jgi:hypothetical protein
MRRPVFGEGERKIKERRHVGLIAAERFEKAGVM